MKARIATAAGTALGALGLLGAFAAPAAAAPLRNCAINLDTGAATCASSEDRAVRAVGAQASLVITRVYAQANYGTGGKVLAFTQARECTPGYDAEWQWDDLSVTSAGDMNNAISSVHTYHQCDVKLFDGKNFTGASSTWIDEAPVLGNIGDGWGNRASSIKFS
ncbi:hypothetical protein [Micromonospora okii]|uniref:hypothetical protein n=1 Tax=Micromonospora okii TaxID=1182970 RepID=UPI001E41F688|nr:hypothetical protein [Micromonospora okii]